MPDSFDDFCNLGYVSPAGVDPKRRGRCYGCIPPPAILKNVFHEYNFSIISNLFDNNKPNALSKHKSTMCEQNASYLEKHSNKIFLNIVEKAQTWLLQYENFQNFSGKHAPEPPRAFLVPQFTLN